MTVCQAASIACGGGRGEADVRSEVTEGVRRDQEADMLPVRCGGVEVHISRYGERVGGEARWETPQR